MPLFAVTPRLLNVAMYPVRCAKVDVRTQFSEKGNGTPSSVARLPRACHTPQWRRLFSCGTVESHCATRRCRTPPGTASPDAVPQVPDWQSLCPERPAVQFLQREWSSMQSRPLRWTSRAVGNRREMGRCGISSRSLDSMASRNCESSWPAVVHAWIKPFAFNYKCMHIYPCL